MNIVDTAVAAGFTHVQTFGGPVPIEQFHLRDALGMAIDLDDPRGPAVLGPWRPATSFEVVAYESKGGTPVVNLMARDRWALLAIAAAEAA